MHQGARGSRWQILGASRIIDKRKAAVSVVLVKTDVVANALQLQLLHRYS